MSNSPDEKFRRLAQRHQVIGWWGLLLFLSLGIVLETLHGLKLGFYLDPAHQIRRLMWTLAHAHGTLIAIVQLAAANAFTGLAGWTSRRAYLASIGLIGGQALLPAGFFLGGIAHSKTDPSPGVLLVPVGAASLLLGVGCVALAALRRSPNARKDHGLLGGDESSRVS